TLNNLSLHDALPIYEVGVASVIQKQIEIIDRSLVRLTIPHQRHSDRERTPHVAAQVKVIVIDSIRDHTAGNGIKIPSDQAGLGRSEEHTSELQSLAY